MNILVSGLSGFIGTSWKKYLDSIKSEWVIKPFDRDLIHNQILLTAEFNKLQVVIHLAGKAHDLLNITSQDEYYKANTILTILLFDEFIKSDATIFIMLSSVKASADKIENILTEIETANPITPYGKSKLLAEEYILSKAIPKGKRVYILRPCMIHGPGNKGNLNLLYKIVSMGLPWPLGAFENKRSFCSIDNLCFIIKDLIEKENIPSGIYNIADDDAISTNELVKMISESQDKKSIIWYTPKLIINTLSKLGDLLRLPLNSERLNKLTETYIVSNNKIKQAVNKSLPVSAKEGLKKTFNSFKNV